MNETPTTLIKFLNGINNTLNIANKAIPLYKEAKPMFQTISKTYTNIKNNTSNISNVIKLLKVKNTIKNDMNHNVLNNKPLNIQDNNINNPTFFI